jgi:hypothetical protein
MNCENAREALLDSLTGPIRADLNQLMGSHVISCGACRRFAEVQRALDVRLTAAVPVVSLSSGFRSSLGARLSDHHIPNWPESLPDIAHLVGCALAILLLLVVLPQYARTILLAGTGFTAVTYFLQAVLRVLWSGWSILRSRSGFLPIQPGPNRERRRRVYELCPNGRQTGQWTQGGRDSDNVPVARKPGASSHVDQLHFIGTILPPGVRYS